MKVVAHLPCYPPKSLVGAWITTHEFLRHLTRDHQVDVVTFAANHPVYDLDGVTVHPRRSKLDADVIVGHAGDRGHAAGLLDGQPLVSMVHGFQPDPRALHRSTLAVFNSKSLQADTKWEGRSVVAHPPIDPASYATTPGTAVTLVNRSPAKGGEVFYNLARRMPHVEFLAVEGGYGRQVNHPRTNVTLASKVVDMRNVYSQTRILLMPSVRETWGRVALEAAASGIPTIATPTPGIVEAMGDAATYVERRDITGWVEAIERLIDPTEWSAASTKALERSTFHDPAAQLTKFTEAITSLVPVHA